MREVMLIVTLILVHLLSLGGFYYLMNEREASSESWIKWGSWVVCFGVFGLGLFLLKRPWEEGEFHLRTPEEKGPLSLPEKVKHNQKKPFNQAS